MLNRNGKVLFLTEPNAPSLATFDFAVRKLWLTRQWYHDRYHGDLRLGLSD